MCGYDYFTFVSVSTKKEFYIEYVNKITYIILEDKVNRNQNFIFSIV